MSDTISAFLYRGVEVKGEVVAQGATLFGSITLTLTDTKRLLTGFANTREVVLYYKPELAKSLEEAFRRIANSLAEQRTRSEAKARASEAIRSVTEAPAPPPPPPQSIDFGVPIHEGRFGC